MTRHCTCPPFPIIDISSIPITVDTNVTVDPIPTVPEDVATKARAACESHGCFYLVVPCPSSLLETIGNTLRVLEDHPNIYHSHSTFHKRLIPLLESLFQSHIIHTAKNERALSVYRSREGGESGNATSNISEPKQSWEYSRCICLHKQPNPHPQQHPIDSFLGQWTIVMHQISRILVNLLKLPTDMIASTRTCHNDGCSYSSSTSSMRCNYDLLRLFRYDAMGTITNSLGSSDHTDWGTLTIVWQDSIGGLQIYCPKHDRYNSVIPLPSCPEPVANTTILLFVHVGDFLTLAQGFHTTHDEFLWPSPIHRVISPKNEPRFSLVYFAYPEPPLTLAQARESMDSITKRKNPKDIRHPTSNISNLLKQLSLLCDQSSTTIKPSNEDDPISTNAIWDFYQQIHHIPFASQVIPNKWSQVQRLVDRHS